MAKKTKKEAAFSVGDKVVYPHQGIGEVKEVTERSFQGKMTPYYNIYLETSDMVVMIPTSQAEELDIRPISSQKETNRVLKLISEYYDPFPSDWKARYQESSDALKNGSLESVAIVVTKLYHRSKVKELPIMERKLYDTALKLFTYEVAFSFKKPVQEVEEIIYIRLESNPNYSDIGSPHSANDNLDSEEDEDI